MIELDAEKLAAWAETKTGFYTYVSTKNCALAQYFKDNNVWFKDIGDSYIDLGIESIDIPNDIQAGLEARPHTFKALASRLRLAP